MRTNILLFFLFIFYNANSQTMFQVYNLDFEIGNSSNVPIGWRLDKGGKDAGYIFSQNIKDAIQGSKSGVLYNFSAENGAAATGFSSVDATPYRNKKVRLSGYFKITTTGDGGEAQVYISQFLKGEKGASDYDSEPIKGATWTLQTVEIDVSQFAEKLNFGFTLNNSGAVFVDDINIEIVNESPNLTAIMKLTDSHINRIAEVSNEWANLRYFMPSDESSAISHESLLIELLRETINTKKDLKEIKSDYLEPIFPAYYKNVFSKPDNTIDNSYLVYKHTAAPNFGTPGFSNSEVKNIFFTDRPREAATFQKLNLESYAGMNYELSCKVNLKAYNSTAQAQFWLKIDKTVGNDIRITNFDNFVGDTGGEWVDYKVSGVLSPYTRHLTIGVIAVGELKAYYDDIKLLVYDDEQKYELTVKNSSFEKELSNEEIPNWTTPISVYGIGYDVSVTDQKATQGARSLLIESDISRRYTYPEPNSKVGTINMPAGLYTTDNGTYPATNELPEFSSIFDINDDISKIALAIDAIAHHDLFFDQTKKIFGDKPKLKQILSRFIKAKTFLDLEYEITKIFKNIKDAQFRTWHLNDKIFSAPFTISKYNDGYYINKIHPKETDIKIGDKVNKINGVEIDEYVNQYLDYQPSSNLEYSINRALTYITIGNKGEEVEIKLENGDTFKKIKKYAFESIYGEEKQNDFEIREGTFYFEPGNFNDKYFKKFIEEYGISIKNVIIDARDNIELSEYFLGYFTKKTIKSNLTKIPIYITPEHTSHKILQIEIPGNLWDRSPNLYFLTNENTAAYTEYIVALAKYHNLATIVGSPTSGSPGESSPVRLIGGFTYSKNTTEVYLPDNSKISEMPIQPDVLVEESSESIRSDRDEALEKVLELIGN